MIKILKIYFALIAFAFCQHNGNLIIEKLPQNAYHYPGGLAEPMIRHYKATNDPKLQKLDSVEIQVDNSKKVLVTSKNIGIIPELKLSNKHMVKVWQHNKIIDSFLFSFADYKSNRIKLSYSNAYGNWQLAPLFIKINNTYWECWIGESEDAIDYYEFFDSTFIYYSCETEEEFYGRYRIKSDSIFTYVDSSQYMHKFTPFKGKFYFNGYYLIPIFFQQSNSNGKWEAPFTDIEPSYKFRRTNKE